MYLERTENLTRIAFFLTNFAILTFPLILLVLAFQEMQEKEQFEENGITTYATVINKDSECKRRSDYFTRDSYFAVEYEYSVAGSTTPIEYIGTDSISDCNLHETIALDSQIRILYLDNDPSKSRLEMNDFSDGYLLRFAGIIFFCFTLPMSLFTINLIWQNSKLKPKYTLN